MTRLHRPSRRGFILVMTLMLLAIAAVALASVARSSMGLAVDAVQARQDLQRRWGNTTARRAALQLAPALFEADETDPPVATLQTQIKLNGLTYTLILSDEQAKANLNAMLHEHGRETTRAFIREQASGQAWADRVSLPNPQTQPKDQDSKQPIMHQRVILSLNHALPSFDPYDTEAITTHPSDTFSCWGDGRINITRAPDDLVRAVIQPHLNTIQIARLRKSLASSGGVSLNETLKTIGISDRDIPKITERLTQDSSCYSVRIVAENKRRSWHEMAVIELQPPGDQAQSDDDSSAGDAGDDTTDGDAVEDTSISVEATPQRANSNVALNQVSDESLTDPDSDPDNEQDTQDNDVYPRLYLYQW